MKENYYFDNAATTWPKPEPVYQFMDSFYRSHGVNPGRGGHTLGVEAEQMVQATRRMLGGFFGYHGDPNRVVFSLNATDSLNLVLRGLLNSSDHMVVSQLDHNAVLRIANHLQRDLHVDVSLVAPSASGYLDVASLEAAITPATKVLVLNHASNVIGAVQDLDAIAAMTTRKGVLLVVDTAQTAGVLPIDMSCGIDVLTFTGHKGLYGPMGVGGLIVAEHVDLPPMRFGGTGVNSAAPFQPEEYPYRLEAGTLSLPGVAGLHAAQKWFAELGRQQGCNDKSHQTLCIAAINHIHRAEMAHVERVWDYLEQFEQVHTLGRLADGDHIAVVSFTVEGMAAQQVAEMLDADYHVCARAGLQCAPEVHRVFDTVELGGALRISPGYFTEACDVDHLLAALTELFG